MEKIRWGVIGGASIARYRALPAMKQARSVELTALASRSAEKAAVVCAELGIPTAYGSYEQLLADPDIDAVYLPLPNHLHCEWAVKAMEAGKHVLCEKPLSLSLAEIKRLTEVRNRTGLHIEEAFVFRNHPQWQRTAEILEAGTIGDVRGMQVTMAMQFLDPNDIRNKLELGGGALYDLGGYVISACSMVFGREPIRVIATIDRDPEMRIDRLSTAILDYGGAHATITVSTQAGPAGRGTHQLLSVLGSTGWLRMDFPLAQAVPHECHVLIGDATSIGGFETSSFTFEPVNQYTLQGERFSRYLLGEDVPTWPIETAATTMKIITAIFGSAATGQWQELD
ncbi:Gfo/Idh/MocA family oxidoreductase [Arthrobacter sp. Z1-9]